MYNEIIKIFLPGPLPALRCRKGKNKMISTFYVYSLLRLNLSERSRKKKIRKEKEGRNSRVECEYEQKVLVGCLRERVRKGLYKLKKRVRE